jgi:hypothetical protein
MMRSQTLSQQSQQLNMEAVVKSNKKYIPPVGPVTLRKDVEQVATLAHPTRPEGERFKVTKALAEKNKLNGWAK